MAIVQLSCVWALGPVVPRVGQQLVHFALLAEDSFEDEALFAIRKLFVQMILVAALWIRFLIRLDLTVLGRFSKLELRPGRFALCQVEGLASSLLFWMRYCTHLWSGILVQQLFVGLDLVGSLLPFTSCLIRKGKLIWRCFVSATLLVYSFVFPLSVVANRAGLWFALSNELVFIDQLAPLQVGFAADLGKGEAVPFVALLLPFKLLRCYLMVNRIKSMILHMRFLAKVLLSEIDLIDVLWSDH